jgi:hypothetical protein
MTYKGIPIDYLFDPNFILAYIRVAPLKAIFGMIHHFPFPCKTFRFKPKIKEDRYP